MKGRTTVETLLLGFELKCGISVYEDATFYVSFHGYGDTVVDNTLSIMLHGFTEDNCVNYGHWFGIDPLSGEVFAWEDSPEQELLD